MLLLERRRVIRHGVAALRGRLLGLLLVVLPLAIAACNKGGSGY